MTINQVINRETNNANTARKVTRTLTLISFSYALLNLPYFIIWSVLYYNETFSEPDVALQNFIYSMMKIMELFFYLITVFISIFVWHLVLCFVISLNTHVIHFFKFYFSILELINFLFLKVYPTKQSQHSNYFKVKLYAENYADNIKRYSFKEV